MAREARALSAHPASEIGDEGRSPMLAGSEPLGHRSAVDLALDGEDRARRRTASSASGARTGSLPRAFAATSASTKNLRLACAQQAASVSAPGLRSPT